MMSRLAVAQTMASSRFNGKTRRFFTSLLPVDQNRTGKCTRCGACCKFVVTCPFLRYAEGDPNSARCAAYLVRPPQCRKYPRTKDEQIHKPCGFRFEDGGE